MERLKQKLYKAAVALRNGEIASAQMSDLDRRIYAAAKEAVGPFGIAIDSICREWAEAKWILGPDITLMEVVRDWKRRHLGQHCAYYN